LREGYNEKLTSVAIAVNAHNYETLVQKSPAHQIRTTKAQVALRIEVLPQARHACVSDLSDDKLRAGLRGIARGLRARQANRPAQGCAHGDNSSLPHEM
jgi:hypothetical protein